MKIGIDNFRCFRHVPSVDVRPITLLVGENSTGKSSFLACLRFVNELFQRGANASFNKDPYSLGSFKEIAHYRGGKAGRAPNFSFTLSLLTNVRRRRNAVEQGPRPVDICLTFREVESQPSVSSISFESLEYHAEIQVGKTTRISYQTPGMREPRSIPADSEPLLSRAWTNLGAVAFLLNELGYRIYSNEAREDGRTDRVAMERMEGFEDILRSTGQAFPRVVFAGAPVRTKPARTYDNVEEPSSPEGSHIPYLLARLREFRSQDWEKLREGLKEFGIASGLFTDIDVKKFGYASSSPFQVSVKIAGPASNLVDVGYGVSQALPLVVETLQASRGSLFLLQQPEVHLHPKAQAALGTYLGEIASTRGHTIVVETHSDYLIDRIRMDVRDKKGIKPEDVSILFFQRSGLDVVIHQLGIDERGNITGAPPIYREFFLQEQINSIM